MTKQDSDIVNQELKKSGAKGVLSGLIFACPVWENKDMQKLKLCPFIDIRLKKEEVRVQWLDDLSEESAKKLVKHHQECIARSER